MSEIVSRKRKIDNIKDNDDLKLNEFPIKNKEESLVLGQGDVGQLGLGEDIFEKHYPTIVPNLENLIQIICGGMHTVALTDSHKIYSWGCNDDFALGRETNEDTIPENIPGLVYFPNKYIPIKLSAGDSHTAVLTECGSNNDGKIGLINEKEHKKTFTLIYEKTNEKGSHAIDIASGNDHLLILTANGCVYSCGSPQQGQLGRFTKSVIDDNGGRRGMSPFFTPGRVPFVCYTRDSKRIKKIRSPIISISCGSFHSFAIDKDGHVFGWGLNNYGQLGFDNIKYSKLDKPNSDIFTEIDQDSLCIYRPIMIGSLSNLSSKEYPGKITGGQHHSLFIDNKEKIVYGFGRTDYGRLGIGKTSQPFYSYPQKVDISKMENEFPQDIACGECTSFIIGNKGNVYSFGMGLSLQLALKDDSDINIPEKAIGKQLEESHGVDSVSSGGQHTALLVKKL